MPRPVESTAERRPPTDRITAGRTPTLLSIQYLRGLAALAVTAMHTGWTRSGLGAAGVDVFFVISGFIMVYVSRRETTPAGFLRARIVRVVPLYWLATAAALLARRDATPARVLTSLAFWPHAGLDGRDYPVVVQGWTLNYEAFFYLLFAAVLCLPGWVDRTARLASLTAVLVGLVLTGLALRPASVAAAVHTGPLLLEFLAGVWLCEAWQRDLLPKTWGAVLLLSLGLLAFAVQIRPGPWRVVTWGLPALLVTAGCLGIEAGGALPRLPGLRTLGDASYALYLTHLLVQRPLLPVLHPYPTLVALPTVVIACIGTGLLVHRAVELPLHRWMRRWTHPRPPAPAGAGIRTGSAAASRARPPG